jgi:hypothetical protein
MGLSAFGAVLQEIFYFKPQVIYVSVSKLPRLLLYNVNFMLTKDSVLDCHCIRMSTTKRYTWGYSNISVGHWRIHGTSDSEMGPSWAFP